MNATRTRPTYVQRRGQGILETAGRDVPVTQRTKRMSTSEIRMLLASLCDETLARLIPEANAEDRKRFDERCDANAQAWMRALK